MSHPTEPAPHPETPEWALPLLKKIHELYVLVNTAINDQAELHQKGVQHDHQLESLEHRVYHLEHSANGAAE